MKLLALDPLAQTLLLLLSRPGACVRSNEGPTKYCLVDANTGKTLISSQEMGSRPF